MHDTVRQHTGEPEPDVTVLSVYPGPELSGELVEDDGITRAYLKGAQARYAFIGAWDGRMLTLVIPKPAGRHRSRRRQWLVRVHAGGRPARRAEVNGRKARPRPGPDGTLEVAIRDDRQKVELRLELGE